MIAQGQSPKVPEPELKDAYNGTENHRIYARFIHSVYPSIRGTFAKKQRTMAEDLVLATGTKREQYEAIIPQIQGLLEGERNLVANLGNVAAALKEQFGWLWVGFYLVDKNDELVLGPFQGPVACTRIKKGRGVCGTSWAEEKTLIVPDVEKFPGHIACSSASRSEIVVPVMKAGFVVAVLDVDSAQLSAFDAEDQQYLEQIVALIPWGFHL